MTLSLFELKGLPFLNKILRKIAETARTMQGKPGKRTRFFLNPQIVPGTALNLGP